MKLHVVIYALIVCCVILINVGISGFRHINTSELREISGGSPCFADNIDSECDMKNYKACGDTKCECRWGYFDAGEWEVDWGDHKECDNYNAEIVVEWRCKKDTTGHYNPTKDFQQCGPAEKGPFNELIAANESAKHYCWQVAICGGPPASCDSGSSGHSYCPDGPNTPKDDEAGLVKKDTCNNNPQKDPCPPKS